MLRFITKLISNLRFISGNKRTKGINTQAIREPFKFLYYYANQVDY